MPEFFRNFFRKEQSPTKIDEETPKQPVIIERPSLTTQERWRSPFDTPEEDILKSYEKKESRLLRGVLNKVLFVELKDDGAGIFKPKSGEHEGLRKVVQAGTYFRRERAAYLVDRFLGFGLIPPTVIREIDGEIGSMQQFIPDAKTEYQVSKDELAGDSSQQQLMKLWILDYIICSSDRKDNLFKDGKIWAIDNGLSFGADPF